MSYQLQFAARPVPAGELEAFAFLNQLRQEAGAQPPAAPLQQFPARYCSRPRTGCRRSPAGRMPARARWQTGVQTCRPIRPVSR